MSKTTIVVQCPRCREIQAGSVIDGARFECLACGAVLDLVTDAHPAIFQSVAIVNRDPGDENDRPERPAPVRK